MSVDHRKGQTSVMLTGYFIFGEIPHRPFFIASGLLIVSAIIAMQEVKSPPSQVESHADM